MTGIDPQKAAYLAANRKKYYWADPESKRAYSRKWRLDNPAKHVLVKSRRSAKVHGHVPIGHGMSNEDAVAEVQSWLDKKPSACEFCENETEKLFLDHNHQTGRIRAWLCTVCNSLEGMIASGRVDRLRSFIQSRESC